MNIKRWKKLLLLLIMRRDIKDQNVIINWGVIKTKKIPDAYDQFTRYIHICFIYQLMLPQENWQRSHPVCHKLSLSNIFFLFLSFFPIHSNVCRYFSLFSLIHRLHFSFFFLSFFFEQDEEEKKIAASNVYF